MKGLSESFLLVWLLRSISKYRRCYFILIVVCLISSDLIASILMAVTPTEANETLTKVLNHFLISKEYFYLTEECEQITNRG